MTRPDRKVGHGHFTIPPTDDNRPLPKRRVPPCVPGPPEQGNADRRHPDLRRQDCPVRVGRAVVAWPRYPLILGDHFIFGPVAGTQRDRRGAVRRGAIRAGELPALRDRHHVLLMRQEAVHRRRRQGVPGARRIPRRRSRPAGTTGPTLPGQLVHVRFRPPVRPHRCRRQTGSCRDGPPMSTWARDVRAPDRGRCSPPRLPRRWPGASSRGRSRCPRGRAR